MPKSKSAYSEPGKLGKSEHHIQMLLGPKDQKEKKITGKGRTLV